MPLLTLGENDELKLKLPSRGDIDWAEDFKLYFAIPIKTKYFVAGIGLLALIDGMANNPGDNIAHFAHLGGMIFGLLILRLWKKQNNLY